MTHEEIIKRFRLEFWKLSGDSAAELDRKQDDYIENMLTTYRAQVLEEVRQVHQNNRNETLWGDNDSNEVMKISINNFIEAVEKELKHPTN